MSEMSGELGIFGKFKKAVGLSPKAPQNVAPPSSPAAVQPDTLGQIVQGVQDPSTGEIRRPDASWRGPGVGQDDNRLMGEARASSPGGEMLNAIKTGSEKPQPTVSNPTHIAPRTEHDNQIINSQPPEPEATHQEPAQPDNVIPIPEAPPTNVVPFPKTPEQPAA